VDNSEIDWDNVATDHGGYLLFGSKRYKRIPTLVPKDLAEVRDVLGNVQKQLFPARTRDVEIGMIGVKIRELHSCLPSPGHLNKDDVEVRSRKLLKLLGEYPIDIVISAIDDCTETCKYFPVPKILVDACEKLFAKRKHLAGRLQKLVEVSEEMAIAG